MELKQFTPILFSYLIDSHVMLNIYPSLNSCMCIVHLAANFDIGSCFQVRGSTVEGPISHLPFYVTIQWLVVRQSKYSMRPSKWL